MTIIRNKDDHRVADLFNNCILVPGTNEVIGVILGNCVYGKDGKIKGKYIQNTIYTTSGYKLATENKSELARNEVNKSLVTQQCWQLINSITDHVCSWVEPVNQWAPDSFTELLLSRSF